MYQQGENDNILIYKQLPIYLELRAASTAFKNFIADSEHAVNIVIGHTV
jgi:hypothetical protein